MFFKKSNNFFKIRIDTCLVHWQHYFGRPAAPSVVQRLSRVCFANTLVLRPHNFGTAASPKRCGSTAIVDGRAT